MEREHEVEQARQARAELLRLANVLLDDLSIRVAAGAPLALEFDASFLVNAMRFVEKVGLYLAKYEADEDEGDRHDTDRPPPLERCMVCGHFHGGQGSCVTAHALVAPSECDTCLHAALHIEAERLP